MIILNKKYKIIIPNKAMSEIGFMTIRELLDQYNNSNPEYKSRPFNKYEINYRENNILIGEGYVVLDDEYMIINGVAIPGEERQILYGKTLHQIFTHTKSAN
jgi:hypothetical protein